MIDKIKKFIRKNAAKIVAWVIFYLIRWLITYMFG